jgi:tetratricopeptide (TPR) repeat protein
VHAVFSFYSAFAAYCVLYLKYMYIGARPKAVDWLAAVVTVLSSLLLFLIGFLRPELMQVGVVRESYPRDLTAHGNLGLLYGQLGQYEKSVTETQEALRMEPNLVVGYVNLVQALLALNRLDEATKAIHEAQQRQLEADYLHQ